MFLFMARLLLDAERLTVFIGARTLLDIEGLRIYDGERIGLVGENGAGKTTLLTLLSGERTPDEGKVHRRCGVARIGQAGDARAEADIAQAKRFGAPQPHEGLSGGEQTRRRIAAALSADAALLLADEPTTDLDAAGIALLEEVLMRFDGAVVLVSHERALLDRVCTRIWHLEDGKLTDFPGGYSDYRAELERRRAYARFEHEQYVREKERLTASMQATHERTSRMRKAPKRMGLSEARLHRMDSRQISGKLHQANRQLESRLERLEVRERPREDVAISMEMGAKYPVRAKVCLELRGLSLTAGGKPLLSGADLQLPTGTRVALTGPNGCGKTTLLRAIAVRAGLLPGVEAPRGIRLNPQVRLGWFDQDHASTLDMAHTAVENVRRGSDCTESDARTVLARLALRRDDALKPAGVLSGGELARVALAKLLLSDANMLMLDEPTNHLDVFTREALEALLRDYRGTVLFVTHDRAFIQAVATREVCIESGRLRQKEPSGAAPQTSRDDAQRRIDIAALEIRLAALAARMSAPARGDDPAALNEQYNAMARKLRALKDQYE